MYIVKKISRYSDGSINVSFFKEFYLGMMCFGSREYAKLFSNRSDAQKICDSLTSYIGCSVEIIEV